MIWLLRGCVSFFGAILLQSAMLMIYFEVRDADVHRTSVAIIQQKAPPSIPSDVSLVASDRAMLEPPSALSDRAILSLFLVEQAMVVGDRSRMDERVGRASITITKALQLNPFSGNLWLMSYWMHVLKHGPDDDGAKLLDASYVTAPFEGWMALRRSRLAWAVFPLLPVATQTRVRAEFFAFLRSGYFDQAINILTGPAWPYRKQLLDDLRSQPLVQRLQISFRLQHAGYRLPIGGVTLPELRPWMRRCDRKDADNHAGVCF